MKLTWKLCATAILAVASAFGAPAITDVLDAGAYTANIAQGSIFVVKGTGLCPTGYQQSSIPYSTAALNGAKITFTPAAGGSGTDAYMLYTYGSSTLTQLAAVLPSTLAVGSYKVTVTYGGATSPSFTTSVMNRKFGILSQDGSGTGFGLVQNYVSATQYDANRYTTGTVSGLTTSPAHPSQLIIVYGTGLGPISGNDGAAPAGADIRGQVEVKAIVGGKTVTVDAYAGRNGYPGLDSVYFHLPGDVTTGCFVPLQISVGGQLSNQTYIAIAPGSAGSCSDSTFNSTTLGRLDSGGTVSIGHFSLTKVGIGFDMAGISGTSTSEAISGGFMRYTGAQLYSVAGLTSVTGACYVSRQKGDVNSMMNVNGTPYSLLDAGANLTLTLPSASTYQVPNAANTYSKTLATVTSVSGFTLGGPSVMTAGTYQLRGTGGADVGSFTASVALGTPVTPSLPSTVTRSAGATVTWTGGSASDTVVIAGGTGATLAAGSSALDSTYNATLFICSTTGDKGTFTVPASVLNQINAVSASDMSNGTGIGFLSVMSTTLPAGSNGIFSAPLTAGGTIDEGLFMATTGISNTPVYQ
jgi:uncharacterized protein (TIGR03437 family)